MAQKTSVSKAIICKAFITFETGAGDTRASNKYFKPHNFGPIYLLMLKVLDTRCRVDTSGAVPVRLNYSSKFVLFPRLQAP